MELYKYQKNIISEIKNKDNLILSVGLGLGKTISCLKYIEESNPETVMIIAPKQVALTVWKQESEKWNLKIKDKFVIVPGGTKKQREDRLNDSEYPYKIVSRDNLNDLDLNKKYDLLIIDELTSFKNPSSKRSKLVYRIKAKKKVGLTGTILANGLIDLWGQFAAIDLIKINFYAWRATYFYNVMQGSGQSFEKWEPKKETKIEDLLAPVKNNMVTLKTTDWIDLPPITYIEDKIELSENEMNEYIKLSSILSVELDNIIYSITEQSKFMKLQTLCNGFIYDNDGNSLHGKYHTKLMAVADFCERAVMENEQVLLFFAFRGEAMFLANEFEKRDIKFCSPADKNYMSKWRNKEIDILMSHPASIAHGVNLQKESHIIVWSSITYNMEYFLQGNGRLFRNGQKYPVQVHCFIAKNTIEEKQYKSLTNKVIVQNNFIEQTKITPEHEKS